MMRHSLLDPIPALDEAMDALSKAADLLVLGDPAAARRVIVAIDEGPLRDYWMAKEERKRGLPRPRRAAERKALDLKVEAGVLARDGWRCRYCGIRIVGAPARRRFVELAGEPWLWGRCDADRHATLLVMSGNADHVVPAMSFVDPARADDLANLVACCWVCNFGKMSHTIESLGLIDPRLRPPIRDQWDGLTRLLASSAGRD